MSNVKSTTDTNFRNDVLDREGYTLVDFWATWCGPCKMLAPILDEISTELDTPIYKIDIDDNNQSPVQFGVRSVPTLIIFKDGKPHATKSGAMPKQALMNWIKQSVA